MMHPTAEALRNAHLDFIEQQLAAPDFIQQELLAFFEWFKQQRVDQFVHADRVHALLQQPLTHTLTSELVNQIERQILTVTQHPINADTTLQDIVPLHVVEGVSDYAIKRSAIRKEWIKKIVSHPTYTDVVSKLVQQSVKDYVEQSMNKKVPAKVGSLMKIGKSVIEKATDSTMDDAINSYFNKNINKISNMSEKLLDKHLSDEKLYNVQDKLWQRIKTIPLSRLMGHANADAINPLLTTAQAWWEHFRQTPYLIAQLSSGIDAWLQHQKHKTWEELMTALHIDESLLKHEIFGLIEPLLQHISHHGYLLERVKIHLDAFYASEAVADILQAE